MEQFRPKNDDYFKKLSVVISGLVDEKLVDSKRHDTIRFSVTVIFEGILAMSSLAAAAVLKRS